MNENLPTNVQLDANGNGSVVFATDVIATIAGLAATEVEGVASMAGTASSSSLADIFTRKNQSSKALTKGVRVDLDENKAVTIHLTIIVDYGSPIPEVAGNIQENVKKAIETMSGLTVSSVDVHVQGVSFEREQRSAAEIEEKQHLMLQKEQEEAKADAAKPAEETKAEEPKAEESKPEEPKAEEPKADEPKAEESTPAEEEDDEGEYELDLGDEPEDDEEDADKAQNDDAGQAASSAADEAVN